MVSPRSVPVLAAGLLGAAVAMPAQVAPAPVVSPAKELGAVEFSRDLDVVLAGRPQKPLFLLFQEIPG